MVVNTDKVRFKQVVVKHYYYIQADMARRIRLIMLLRLHE